MATLHFERDWGKFPGASRQYCLLDRLAATDTDHAGVIPER
jgi:hypothetical protein